MSANNTQKAINREIENFNKIQILIKSKLLEYMEKDHILNLPLDYDRAIKDLKNQGVKTD